MGIEEKNLTLATKFSFLFFFFMQKEKELDLHGTYYVAEWWILLGRGFLIEELIDPWYFCKRCPQWAPPRKIKIKIKNKKSVLNSFYASFHNCGITNWFVNRKKNEKYGCPFSLWSGSDMVFADVVGLRFFLCCFLPGWLPLVFRWLCVCLCLCLCAIRGR